MGPPVSLKRKVINDDAEKKTKKERVEKDEFKGGKGVVVEEDNSKGLPMCVISLLDLFLLYVSGRGAVVP